MEGTLGFIGAGSLVAALLPGVLAAGVYRPEEVWLANRSDRSRLEGYRQEFGVRPAEKGEVATSCATVVLAVKPKDVAPVLAEIGGLFGPGQLLICVAAGISLAGLERRLAPQVAVVRAMPNTSCRVGAAVTALAGGRWAGPEELGRAEKIFGAVGRTYRVREADLDAVTGLSGSGPAYVYLFTEALIAAGRAAGLDPALSRELAVQTVYGAGCMLSGTGEDPAALRRAVSSPGGTTVVGLAALEERGLVQAVREAVLRAAARSREMGREYDV